MMRWQDEGDGDEDGDSWRPDRKHVRRLPNPGADLRTTDVEFDADDDDDDEDDHCRPLPKSDAAPRQNGVGEHHRRSIHAADVRPRGCGVRPRGCGAAPLPPRRCGGAGPRRCEAGYPRGSGTLQMGNGALQMGDGALHQQKSLPSLDFLESRALIPVKEKWEREGGEKNENTREG